MGGANNSNNYGRTTDDGTRNGETTYDGAGDSVNNTSGTNLGEANNGNNRGTRNGGLNVRVNNETFEEELNDRRSYEAGVPNDETIDSLSTSINDFLDKQPTM